MARKVTEEDWKRLETEIKSSEFRYKILDVDDGEVTVEFLDTIYETHQGEEDLLGRVWEKEWAKIEAKVLIDGTPYVMSFAWHTSPIFRTFKARCQEHGLSPDDLPGTVWKFQKKSAAEYIIKFVGKSESKKKFLDIPNKDYEEIVEVINSLKDEPELLADGINESDFVKAIAIRTNSKVASVRDLMPKLVEDKLIKIDNGKIFLVD